MEMVSGSTNVLIKENKQVIIKKDDVVIVFGLGPAGLLFLQEARILQAGSIIGIGKHKFRLDKAEKLGFNNIYMYDSDKTKDMLKKSHGLADVIIDTTGKNIIDDILSLIKEGGIICQYRLPRYSSGELLELQNKKNVSVQSGESNMQFALESVNNWLLSEKMNLRTLVTRHIELKDIKVGLDICIGTKNEVLKVAVDIP